LSLVWKQTKTKEPEQWPKPSKPSLSRYPGT
jgi:hypothetical protein